MLGANFDDVGWPECAEIDVAEWFGDTPNPAQVAGSLHTATDNITQNYTMSSPGTGLHTYSLDWRPTSLVWSVDGVAYQTVLKRHLASWPYDAPMFLILNLAVGGTRGGVPPATGGLPYTMTVKSVNLYNAEVC